MRRGILLINALFYVCVQFTSAQIVNIPDSRFLGALIFNGVDKNKNKQIELEEALTCDSLGVNTTFGITDLTGIEAFVNLRILNCIQNSLTSLDVSKNTKLTRLLCGYNKIKSLDVSKNIELVEFECVQNSFLVLDISKNTKLKRLYILYNKITSIDLHNNPTLEYIDAGWSKLTSLDVSKNPLLNYLDVRGNVNLSTICVFDTNYAKSNTKFQKDAAQKWTENCSQVTGLISEPSPQILFYPNPAKDQVHLVEGYSQVVIFNNLGQVVMSSLDTIINIGSLPNGVYRIQMIDANNQFHCQKLVKE